MSKIILGSEVEGEAKILNIQELLEDSECIDDVFCALESKGCKITETPWCDGYSEETLVKLDKVIKLSENFDVYRVRHYIEEGTQTLHMWEFYVAVPRDYIMIPEGNVIRVSPEGLASDKERVIEFLEELAENTRIIKKHEPLFLDLKEQVEKLRKTVGEEITSAFLNKLRTRLINEEN